MKPHRPNLLGTSSSTFPPLPMGFIPPFAPNPPPFYQKGGIIAEEKDLERDMEKEARKGNFFQRKY